MADKDQKDSDAVLPEVGVTAKAPPPSTLRDSKTQATWEKVLDPMTAVTNSMNNAADRERMRGHEANAVATKMTAGAMRLTGAAAEGAIGGGPVGAALGVHNEAGRMVIDHLNNPDLVVKHLAKDGYGTEAHLRDEYRAFQGKMDEPIKAKTVGGNIGGLIGRLAVNTVTGGDAIVEGGRTVNRFADMVHSGGSVEEYKQLEAAANSGDGMLQPNDYIKIRKEAFKSGGEQQADASVAKLKTALLNGGNSANFPTAPGKQDEYVAGEKNDRAEVYKSITVAGGNVQEYQKLKEIAVKNSGSLTAEDYKEIKKAEHKGSHKESIAELKEVLTLGGSSDEYIEMAKVGKANDYKSLLKKDKAELEHEKKQFSATAANPADKAYAAASSIKDDLAAKNVAGVGAEIPDHQLANNTPRVNGQSTTTPQRSA